jgi:phospholipase/lecithinase/hemolysin
MLVAGLPPVGCLPLQLTMAELRQPPRPQGCIAEQNTAAESYNAKLQRMLAEFQSASPGARAVYADIYTPLMDMVDHPDKYGEYRRNAIIRSDHQMAVFSCSDMTAQLALLAVQIPY